MTQAVAQQVKCLLPACGINRLKWFASPWMFPWSIPHTSIHREIETRADRCFSRPQSKPPFSFQIPNIFAISFCWALIHLFSCQAALSQSVSLEWWWGILDLMWTHCSLIQCWCVVAYSQNSGIPAITSHCYTSIVEVYCNHPPNKCLYLCQ